MIHRALFGSIERFFGVLTEHYAGAFPVWLAPVQVVGIPVAETFAPHLQTVVDRLRNRRVRAEVDYSDDRMQKKIRNHTTAKVPFMLLAGERDVEAGAVSFPLPRRHPAQRCAGRRCRGGHRRMGRVAAQRLADRRVDERRARRCETAMTPGDGLQRLWTPHRMSYVTAAERPGRRDGHPFIDIPMMSDEDGLIVAAAKRCTPSSTCTRTTRATP